MDSEVTLKANLKKYIKIDGKWRFVPVLNQNRVPYPSIALIDGEPARSTTGMISKGREEGSDVKTVNEN